MKLTHKNKSIKASSNKSANTLYDDIREEIWQFTSTLLSKEYEQYGITEEAPNIEGYHDIEEAEDTLTKALIDYLDIQIEYGVKIKASTRPKRKGNMSVRASKRRAVKAADYLRSTKKTDDGTFSYSIDENSLYYNVPGAYFIWKGEWADPWVEYEGSVYSAADLDDGVYADFSEYCKENGLTFADWREEDAAFDEWAKEYGQDSAEGWLYDMSPFAEVIETSGDYRWAKEL